MDEEDRVSISSSCSRSESEPEEEMSYYEEKIADLIGDKYFDIIMDLLEDEKLDSKYFIPEYFLTVIVEEENLRDLENRFVPLRHKFTRKRHLQKIAESKFNRLVGMENILSNLGSSKLNIFKKKN